MRLILLIIMLSISLTTIFPIQSHALSCVELEGPAIDHFDTAIVGTVLDVKNDKVQKGFTGQKETKKYVLIADYEVWSFSENNAISFLSEVMGTSFIDAEKFLTGMSTELPSQVKEMFTVYKVNNEPVGVVFPHIEPNTDKEGRIFWIGIHPNFLGTGLGRNLHTIGLYRLKNEFKAMSYLGMTQVDNIPMRNIMVSNGCIQNKNTVIYLQYSI